MAKQPSLKPLTRRAFIARGYVASALAMTVSAAETLEARKDPIRNPFAYELGQLNQTDPALLSYREDKRWRTPHEVPRRLTMSPDDRLYLGANRFISELDEEGAVVSEIALSTPARSIAVSKEGDVYVSLRDHIEIYSRNGQLRASWEPSSPRAWITGIALSGDDVFLADAGNRVILKCDRVGKVLQRLGEKNTAKNLPGFIIPSPFFDLKLHRDGLLRVTNPGRHRIEAFTLDGELEFYFGKPSAAIDGFCGCCNPINLALLGDGRIVTCEKGLPRVKVYKSDGSFDSVIAGPEFFPENSKALAGEGLSERSHGGLDAAVDSRGRILVLDLVTGNIHRMVRRSKGMNSDEVKPKAKG